MKPVDDAVATVIAECRRDLLRFLRQQLSDAIEAPEALQDFFVRAFGSAAQERHPENLRAWLGRVLQTTLIEHDRRQSARVPGELPFRPTIYTAVAPEEEFDAVVCTCLYKLLPTLKPEYAEIVWQADLVGASRERIAALLGTTVNNAGVRLHRARRAVRRRLEQACVTCPAHGFLNCVCEYASTTRGVERSAEDSAPRPAVVAGA